MPVGCLGDPEGSVSNMETMLTSSVLNTADQFAFMQQTLLLQIFRVNQTTTSPRGSPQCNGNGKKNNARLFSRTRLFFLAVPKSLYKRVKSVSFTLTLIKNG